MSIPKILLTILLLVMISGYVTYRVFDRYYLQPQAQEAKKTRSYKELPNLIQVEVPAKNSVIGENLNIKGKARGYWFFEGVFPVSILDDTGYIVAEGNARALGDWKTTDMVPFEGNIEIVSVANSERGIIKIKRDEQKGSDAQYIEVPIRFKEFKITKEE